MLWNIDIHQEYTGDVQLILKDDKQNNPPSPDG